MADFAIETWVGFRPTLTANVMKNEKSKAKPIPPDVRLAKAFGFTGEDLAINRSGYMSPRQQGMLDVWIQLALGRLSHILGKSLESPVNRGFPTVDSVCGRVRLKHAVIDRLPQGVRGSQTLNDVYTLTMDDPPAQFNLNAAQFVALSDSVVYRLYFDPTDRTRILSIERLTGGCT